MCKTDFWKGNFYFSDTVFHVNFSFPFLRHYRQFKYRFCAKLGIQRSFSSYSVCRICFHLSISKTSSKHLNVTFMISANRETIDFSALATTIERRQRANLQLRYCFTYDMLFAFSAFFVVKRNYRVFQMNFYWNQSASKQTHVLSHNVCKNNLT